jgi:hypothetical protein
MPGTLPNAPYINELVNKHVLEGVDANRFAPDAPLTREQFAKMVVLAFGLKADGTEAPFTDVTSEWAKPYIAAAYHHQLIQGAGPTLFHCCNLPVTSMKKEEMHSCKLLHYRYTLS